MPSTERLVALFLHLVEGVEFVFLQFHGTREVLRTTGDGFVHSVLQTLATLLRLPIVESLLRSGESLFIRKDTSGEIRIALPDLLVGMLEVIACEVHRLGERFDATTFECSLLVLHHSTSLRHLVVIE